jgi:hypothetical protein
MYRPEIQLSLNKKTALPLKTAGAGEKELFRKMFPRLPMHPSETLLAMKKIPEITLEPRKSHTLGMDITIPEEAKAGSIYYLHILQKAKNRIMGGYTVVITVREQKNK